MFRDGRWFWWVVAGCLTVVVADVREIGPFSTSERRPAVEVLGDSVERTPSTTTTSTSTTVTPAPTTLSEDEALEQLQGLDQETLDALEGIRGVDPAELTTTTTR